MTKQFIRLLLIAMICWLLWREFSVASYIETDDFASDIKVELLNAPRKWLSEIHYEREIGFHKIFKNEENQRHFWDSPVLQFYDEELLIFTSGPFSLDAGYRYFLPLKQTEILFLSRKDLKPVYSFRLKAQVNRLAVRGKNIYFRYDEHKYGILTQEIPIL